MGLSSSTLSLEGVAFSKLSKTHSIMFRFALFALVAVAAAEPQWVHPYAVHNAAHLKTPSGDTVSVQAAKIQHHQLKAAEYAKKAYVPYAYHSGVVAAPVANAVYNVPATYAAATIPYTHGVYSGHYIGKREAEADSQYYTHLCWSTPILQQRLQHWCLWCIHWIDRVHHPIHDLRISSSSWKA